MREKMINFSFFLLVVENIYKTEMKNRDVFNIIFFQDDKFLTKYYFEKSDLHLRGNSTHEVERRK